MKTLRTITGEDFNFQRNDPKGFKLRESARAVVLNEKDEVALLYSSKYDYYQLPGGGLEDGEEIHIALEREILEEIGCTINVINELGKVIEYRDEHELKQISFCFLGRLLELKQDPEFTSEELDCEFKLKWLDLNKAIKIFEEEKPKRYEGHFMVLRNKILLEKTKEFLKI
jgi:8-oxo-dGTP diphosphatase